MDFNVKFFDIKKLNLLFLNFLFYKVYLLKKGVKFYKRTCLFILLLIRFYLFYTISVDSSSKILNSNYNFLMSLYLELYNSFGFEKRESLLFNLKLNNYIKQLIYGILNFNKDISQNLFCISLVKLFVNGSVNLNYLELGIYNFLYDMYNFHLNYIISNLNFLLNTDFKLDLKKDGYIYKGFLYIPHFLFKLSILEDQYKFKRLINYNEYLNFVFKYLYWLHIFLIFYEYYVQLGYLQNENLEIILEKYLKVFWYTFDIQSVLGTKNLKLIFQFDLKKCNINLLKYSFFSLIKRIIYLLDIKWYLFYYKK